MLTLSEQVEEMTAKHAERKAAKEAKRKKREGVELGYEVTIRAYDGEQLDLVIQALSDADLIDKGDGIDVKVREEN
jgi:putative lipoic acid-binding regulatory protein